MHEKGLAASREKARAFILAGKVYVNGERVDKPGSKVTGEAEISLKDSGHDFVSRGGTKLAGAIAVMKLDFANKTVLDVGASTGGFTDCALRHGARHVHAVDVGYGQLDWGLRQDPRVTVMERTNIRYLTPDRLQDKFDLATIDVAFISLELVLPAVVKLLADQGEVVALVKPQFEAGREQVGKNGVVRDAKIHETVLRRVMAAGTGNGLVPENACYSPIKGPKGNIEYFIHFRRSSLRPYDQDKITELVAQAHIFFGS
jgi:23S rRNA (cytidine1920-2'-O)/16S rRNA (cytidine1409-2'-O)-methyltransferase